MRDLETEYGYPQYKRYSKLILGSYDSPEHVYKLELKDDLPNDFRKEGTPANPVEK